MGVWVGGWMGVWVDGWVWMGGYGWVGGCRWVDVGVGVGVNVASHMLLHFMMPVCPIQDVICKSSVQSCVHTYFSVTRSRLAVCSLGLSISVCGHEQQFYPFLGAIGTLSL